MDFETESITNEAGNLTISITPKAQRDGHRRNISVDSGFDTSGVTISSSQGESDSAMTDLSQENATSGHCTTDRPHKLSKNVHGRTSNASADSGVGGSISQESVEMDDSGCDGNQCGLPEKTSDSDHEMDAHCTLEDDPLQQGGDDSPDCPESIISQAVRSFYSPLVEVISNQVTVDTLASDLYTYKLIEYTVHGVVKQSISEVAKARQILDAVMSKLRTSPSVEPFDLFVQVLDSYPSCCDLVEQIKVEYQQLQQRSEHQSSEVSMSVSCNMREEVVYSSSGPAMVPSQERLIKQNPWSSQQPSPSLGAIETSRLFAFPIRQRSTSSGAESDASMTEEEIQEGIRRLAKGIKKYARKNQKSMDTIEETLRRTESLVKELEAQKDEYSKKMLRCNEEKQILEGQLIIARRQILQLNSEVLKLRRPQQHPCTGLCEHKMKCEKLKKQIKRLEEEKIDYIAKIENLTLQRDQLLKDYAV